MAARSGCEFVVRFPAQCNETEREERWEELEIRCLLQAGGRERNARGEGERQRRNELRGGGRLGGTSCHHGDDV
jgi:hypothetical protein